jgi:DNA replicative helicase MCM subunit Mcm2 (Cdc46/Mcm family)
VAAEAERDPSIIPQDLLRKYVTYAKQTCRPTFQANDYEKIAAVRPAGLTSCPGMRQSAM